MSRFLVFIFLSFLLTSAGSAEGSKKSFVWATESFPPFYVNVGTSKGKGTVDQIIKILSKELPQYENSTEFMPILRIIDELKSGSNTICASFLYDPKTIGYSQYSDPIFAVPPLQLTLKQEIWEKMGKPSELSLKELLAKEKFVIGLSDGRNYGKKITPMLNEALGNNHAIHVRSGDHFVGLADMVLHERIDAAIGYNGEVNYYLHSAPTKNSLVSVPISEISAPLKVYAVAPKTEWGNEFIEQFNLALKEAKKLPEFRSAITDWFGKSDKLNQVLDELSIKN